MDKGRGIYEEGKEKNKEQDFKSYKWKERQREWHEQRKRKREGCERVAHLMRAAGGDWREEVKNIFQGPLGASS